MATRYEIIKNLGRNFLVLIQNGIISITLLEHKTMYEDYLDELNSNNVTKSVSNISIKYDVSMRKIFRIVAYMEQKTTDKTMS
jgi:hypothetical protein